ncbi:hypothetical protein [Aquimarina sp. AU474]|uniref:hypothetical protein n=1 Tax=Aquimarina sp. AU474 TaxID=2108529 RepID=UPI00135941C0|nr:hypothetical protein [Aquimarina sp. AU474]
MKNSILKFGLTVFLSILLIGCSENESDEVMTESLKIEEAELSAKIDNSAEVISDTFLQIYEFEESPFKSSVHPFIPECATITIEITDSSKAILVDFGSEGCEVRGRLIKGKVNMSYEVDTDTKALVINYILEDFFIDDIQFEGSKTITRQRINENGNPQYIMDLDFKVTFANGTEASRIGTKTREWVEGVLNGNWGDNVFLITGAWETNFVNGNTHSTTITTPVRREASCKFLVSGEVELVRTNFSGTLNYGEGECDNLAVFVNADGEEKEIRL